MKKKDVYNLFKQQCESIDKIVECLVQLGIRLEGIETCLEEMYDGARPKHIHFPADKTYIKKKKIIEALQLLGPSKNNDEVIELLFNELDL